MPRRGMQQRWLTVCNAVIAFVLFSIVILECRWCTQLAGPLDPKHPPRCVVTEGEREVVGLFLIVLVSMESSFAATVEHERRPSEAFRR